MSPLEKQVLQAMEEASYLFRKKAEEYLLQDNIQTNERPRRKLRGI